MGRQRSGTRKHILLCAAGLIVFFSLMGCATLKGKAVPRAEEQSHQYLVRGRDLFAHGDYEGALRENEKVLSLEGNKPPADRALFYIGLIYASPGNPKKDYRKSLNCFTKLIQDYPQSVWIEEAKVMTGMLYENQKLNQIVEKSAQDVERLNRMIERSIQVDIEIEDKKRQRTK